jgi:hypothetical protein
MNPSSVSKPTVPIFTSNLMPFTEHLPHRKWNKNNLNSFADRIAHFKKSLISLLYQQAVQHPGKHVDVLAQIESRLETDRAFFATNEEVAEAYLSKQLKQEGEASVRPVSLNYSTAGFLSFLWLLGPGRPPLEAIRWCGRAWQHQAIRWCGRAWQRQATRWCGRAWQRQATRWCGRARQHQAIRWYGRAGRHPRYFKR